jgi:glutathione S-transferase
MTLDEGFTNDPQLTEMTMRLLYSAGSPFARIVRIALLETGFDEKVSKQEISRARLYSPESDVLTHNPVGRVPTLVLDDGTILTESNLILRFIDAVSPSRKLLPLDGSDGWLVLSEMGQAWGLLEGIVSCVRAGRLPNTESASFIISRETARVNRIADVLETAVSTTGFGGPINAAQIVLGSALALANARLRPWAWRVDRPRLSAWYDRIAERPSFRATEPPPL